MALDQDLVVLAPRESSKELRLKKALKTASITDITSSDFSTQAASLTQVLSESANVDTARYGGPGAVSGIFLRGLPSQHMAVFIDGIPYQDISASSGALDGSLIGIEGVDSILVLKGPQGPRYGSSAMAGVILIETKKNSSEATLEVDSIPSVLIGVSQSKKNIRSSYSIAARTGSSAGISAARTGLGGGTAVEKDPSSHYQIRARLQNEWSPSVETEGAFLFQKMDTAIDDFTLALTDAPNLKVTTDTFLGSLKTTGHWGADHQTSLRLQASRIERNQNSPLSRFFGTQGTVGLLHESHVSEGYQFQVGIEKNFEFTALAQQNSLSLYTEHEVHPAEPLTLEVAGRIEPDSSGSTPATYRLGFRANLVEEVREDRQSQGLLVLRSSVGTGFKRPSLFQLSDTSYGNPNLQPEKIWAWDASLDWNFARRGSATIGVFSNELTNLIDIKSGRYNNIAGAKTWGAEVGAKIPLSRSLLSEISYHYLKTQNTTTGASLFRRAQDRVRTQLTWEPVRRLELWSAAHFVGSRTDVDGSGNTITLASYWNLSLGSSWQASRDWKLYTKVDNLLNSDIEEIAGYSSLGTTITTGFNYIF